MKVYSSATEFSTETGIDYDGPSKNFVQVFSVILNKLGKRFLSFINKNRSQTISTTRTTTSLEKKNGQDIESKAKNERLCLKQTEQLRQLFKPAPNNANANSFYDFEVCQNNYTQLENPFTKINDTQYYQKKNVAPNGLCWLVSAVTSICYHFDTANDLVEAMTQKITLTDKDKNKISNCFNTVKHRLNTNHELSIGDNQKAEQKLAKYFLSLCLSIPEESITDSENRSTVGRLHLFTCTRATREKNKDKNTYIKQGGVFSPMWGDNQTILNMHKALGLPCIVRYEQDGLTCCHAHSPSSRLNTQEDTETFKNILNTEHPPIIDYTGNHFNILMPKTSPVSENGLGKTEFTFLLTI